MLASPGLNNGKISTATTKTICKKDQPSEFNSAEIQEYLLPHIVPLTMRKSKIPKKYLEISTPSSLESTVTFFPSGKVSNSRNLQGSMSGGTSDNGKAIK